MKKFTLMIVAGATALSLQAQEVITEAHPTNYRSWALGVNVNNTFFFGDLSSFEPEKDDAIDAGGIEIGAGLHLTKWVAPSIGVRLGANYNSFSGSNGQIYFEGNGISGNIDVLFNLSNMFLQGKMQDRRSALLAGAGAAWQNSKSFLYDINGNEIAETGVADRAGNPVNPPGRSNQPYLSALLEYKYRLTNGLDLDLGFRHNFFGEDWLDVFSVSRSANDQFSQLYLGITYNFGDKENVSVVYTNPLDDIYATVEEVKDNFEKLTTDDDNDGVNNFFDKESNTPEGAVVDGAGQAFDADADGIPDYMDADPFTAKGAQVDADGRAIDSDNDGVPDYRDQEANTPEGTMVNFMGKTIKQGTAGGGTAYVPSIFFAFNSAEITAANYQRLAVIAKVMKANSDLKFNVVGHADKRGSEEYNKNLAMRRAKAVVKALNQSFGIDEGRFTTESEGESDPLAEGRYSVNRRADLNPM